ncbi:MAG: glycosyltransferase [Cryomorphaceae bacterium]|nr:glycosyltransferase [Cryomorphaceae bacterium]
MLDVIYNNSLLTVVCLLFGIQLFFVIRMLRFSPLPKRKFGELSPVSVIVCGRNEAENWPKLLAVLEAQTYPDCEIVLVNDRSSDDSILILEAFAKKHLHVRIVDVQENDHFNMGKKFALTLGIKAAKNEFLVFTDADCIPNDALWLEQMVSGFAHGDIVLGYGDYYSEKGFLNSLIRWETLQSAMLCFSAAQAGYTYTAVGRNLAYTKSLFFREKGFSNHIKIPMGDDDLFVNHAAPKVKVGWSIGEKAKTMSHAAANWKDWWHQKRRHLAASGMYRKQSKIVLGLYGMSKAFFHIGVLALLFTPLYYIGIALWLFYALLLTIAAWRFAKMWNLGKLFWYAPWLDAVLFNLQGLIMLNNFFKAKPKTW